MLWRPQRPPAPTGRPRSPQQQRASSLQCPRGLAAVTLTLLLATLASLLALACILAVLAWPPRALPASAGDAGNVWQQLWLASAKPRLCIAWRATSECDPAGVRVASGDRPCWAPLPAPGAPAWPASADGGWDGGWGGGPQQQQQQLLSGFCQCEDGTAAAAIGCGRPTALPHLLTGEPAEGGWGSAGATFTCAEECARLALLHPAEVPRLPAPLRCDGAAGDQGELLQLSALPLPAGVLPAGVRYTRAAWLRWIFRVRGGRCC